MVDFPFFQNLYVIPLLCHGRIIEVQIVLHSKERDNKARLCANFSTMTEYILELSYNLYQFIIKRIINALFTLPLHVVQDSNVFHIPHIANILDANHIPETVYVQLKS